MAPIDGDLNVTRDNAWEVLKRDEFKNLTREELIILADEKSSSKEAKETFVKSLEFESDTFKIDGTGWKEVTDADKDDPILAKFVGKEPKVKVNATGDVVEYLDWPAKGEQIFITYDAFIREVMKAKNCTQEEVESKYLMTPAEFRKKMEDKSDNSEEYTSFFNKEVKWHLAGLWNPSDEIFTNIGDHSRIWLAGNLNASFDEDGWGRSNNFRSHGFSGRLLKN